jgi:hypothetical protein
MATGYLNLSALPSSPIQRLTSSGFSSEIPTIVTPLSAYFAWSAERCGIDVLHGPHQVAQNSTT